VSNSAAGSKQDLSLLTKPRLITLKFGMYAYSHHSFA